MEMLRQYLRRLVGAFAVVAIATFLLSLLMRLLPGDPIAVMVPNSTEDLREMMRKETGLDRGIFGYYWQWFSNMFKGNFGQ